MASLVTNRDAGETDAPGSPERAPGWYASLSKALAGGLPAAQWRAVSASLGLRVWSALATFAVTVLLANLLGAAVFGAYAFALGWVSILLVVTTFGFHHFNVREIARLVTIGRRDAIAGLLMLSLVVGAGLSLATLAGASALADWLPLSPDPLLESAFVFGALLLPLMTLNSIRQGVLRGLGRPVMAQLPELGLFPTLLFGLVAVAALAGLSLSARAALGLNIVAAGAALLFGMVLLVREWRRQALPWRGAIDAGPWFRGAGYSLLIGAAATINGSADLVMLGALTDAEQTGAYGLAARFVLLLTMPLLAVTSGLSHDVSTLFNKGALGRLESLVRDSGRLALILTTLLAVGISALTPFLGLLFGAEFAMAAVPLLILTWSRVIESLVGPASMVLINTRHAGLGALCVGGTAVINVALNLTLIPLLGLVGAALATALAQVLQALLMARFVHIKLGIATAPLARPLRTGESGAGV